MLHRIDHAVLQSRDCLPGLLGPPITTIPEHCDCALCAAGVWRPPNADGFGADVLVAASHYLPNVLAHVLNALDLLDANGKVDNGTMLQCHGRFYDQVRAFEPARARRCAAAAVAAPAALPRVRSCL